MHYFRILPEYWEDRLRKLKAAGFNTVETYVCWNLHEPRKGEFDFSGRLDLVSFLETAQRVGLYALVRPGPYICGEWDFGGLPAWLLRDRNMRLRCSDPRFVAHVADFFPGAPAEAASAAVYRGGNLLAVQVENEYGSYGNDKSYLRQIRDLIRSCGIDVLLFTSDGATAGMLSGGTVEDVLPTVNFGSGADKAFQALESLLGGGLRCARSSGAAGLIIGGEASHRDPASLLRELTLLLDQDASFSMYMFHGGTNFGFTAGANQHIRYNPTVTSYDYDAPLNEYGDYTPQYFAVRELLCRRQGMAPPPLPPRPERQNLGQVQLTEQAELLKKFAGSGDGPSESHAGEHGVLRAKFWIDSLPDRPAGDYEAGVLTLENLRDRAYVYRDGQLLGTVDPVKPRGFWSSSGPRIRSFPCQPGRYQGAGAGGGHGAGQLRDAFGGPQGHIRLAFGPAEPHGLYRDDVALGAPGGGCL